MTGPPAPSALSAVQERLQRDYRPAFLRYLARRDEPSRHAGYELGRAAVGRGQSMLDLVAAHHVTLTEVLPDARDAEEVLRMCSAASEFLTEVLTTFAMASSAFPALREQLEDVHEQVAELRAAQEPGPAAPALRALPQVRRDGGRRPEGRSPGGRPT